MSAPIPAPATDPVAAHAIRKAVTRRLAAHFLEPDDSTETARQDALHAVAACDPRTPHDILLIGRLVSLSLAAIGATVGATEAGLPARQQLQFLARANALSRSAQQAETALARSRLAQPPVPSTTLAPADPQHPAEPVPLQPMPSQPVPSPGPTQTRQRDANADHFPADPLQALINQVMAEEQAMAARSVAASPQPGAQGRNAPTGPIATPQHPVPPTLGEARSASFRDALMQSSAMLRSASS